MESALQDREFKESFKKVALPVALQNLLFSSLNFVDSLMLGMLGQTEYNAAGIGNQFYMIINVIIVGFTSAVLIYVTQYFGNSDLKGFRKSVGLGLISSFTFGLIAFIFSVSFPEFILSFYTDDVDIIREGVKYLRIMSIQMLIIGIILPFATASRASKNAKIPLIISGTAFAFNTFMNYVLIFGNFGAPEMGVEGAAVATVLARVLSLVLYLIVIISSKDNPLHGNIRDYINIKKAFVLKVLKTGWSVILHETLWVLAISLYTAILSKNRTDGYTAYLIGIQFMMIQMTFSMAVSSAASVTIGAQLGRKDIEKALLYEKKYSKTQIIVSLTSSIIVIIAAYLMVDLFEVSEAIKNTAFYVCISLCMIFPFKTYSGMLSSGILRAGGDTKVPVFLELFGMYLFDAPILYILLKTTQLTTPVIIFFGSISSVITSVLLTKRVNSKKWAKNLISEED